MTLFAVVPVKDLTGTKSRLKPVLNPFGRAGLTVYMMKNVLAALREAGVEHACVVSPDPTVLQMAEEEGAATLLQKSQGLNPALEEARDWATAEGASALLVFPADLPLLCASDVEAVLEAAEADEGALAVISPDAAGRGTNALLLPPPDAFPFLFGAKGFAARYEKDPRHIEVVLRESRRIVRMDRGIIISETHHGFVCANAGVDTSNVPGSDTVCLLPLDPDASARRLRDSLAARFGVDLAVVISDSFGRPWREGIANVAIGVAGMKPLADYRGEKDPYDYPLMASILAIAD